MVLGFIPTLLLKMPMSNAQIGSSVLDTQGNKITKMQNHVCSNDIFLSLGSYALHYQEAAGEGEKPHTDSCNNLLRNTAHTTCTPFSLVPRFTLIHFPMSVYPAVLLSLHVFVDTII